MLYKTMTIACSVLTAAALMMPVDGRSQTTDLGEAAHLKAGHKKVEGVVSDIKSGLFTVKTPTGSTYTLTETAAIRHGHGAPKVGDEMTLWVNEANMVIDAHPKGQAGNAHRIVAGKLLKLDNAKSEIKLSTPDGEKSLKIKPETRKFTDLAVGTPVIVELNEQGEVIDIHKDKK
jgi:hypothetical protein